MGDGNTSILIKEIAYIYQLAMEVLMFIVLTVILVNPQRIRERGTIVGLCVCLD